MHSRENASSFAWNVVETTTFDPPVPIAKELEQSFAVKTDVLIVHAKMISRRCGRIDIARTLSKQCWCARLAWNKSQFCFDFGIGHSSARRPSLCSHRGKAIRTLRAWRIAVCSDMASSDATLNVPARWLAMAHFTAAARSTRLNNCIVGS